MVVLEDDLKLAPDAVHFFLAMSTVMQRDNSLLCVCAHADNAFYAATRSEMELLMLHHHHANHQSADTQQQQLQESLQQTSGDSVPRSGVRSAEEAGLVVGLDGLDGLPMDEDDGQRALPRLFFLSSSPSFSFFSGDVGCERVRLSSRSALHGAGLDDVSGGLSRHQAGLVRLQPRPAAQGSAVRCPTATGTPSSTLKPSTAASSASIARFRASHTSEPTDTQ